MFFVDNLNSKSPFTFFQADLELALSAMKGGEVFDVQLSQRGWSLVGQISGDSLVGRHLTTDEVMSVVGSSFWIVELEAERTLEADRVKARARDSKEVTRVCVNNDKSSPQIVSRVTVSVTHPAPSSHYFFLVAG
jgi:hypothetical protein